MRILIYTLFSLLTILTFSSMVTADSTAATPPHPGAPHEVSSEVCGTCHKEIFAEWRSSMHSQSTALKDPIHGAFYRKLIGDPTVEGITKKDKYPVCLRCHAPNAAVQKKTKLDAKPAFNEGVNCVFCHTITGFKGTVKENGKLRLGQAAYTNSTTHLQAPSGKNYSTAAPPATPNETTPAFHPFPMEGKSVAVQKSNAICMGCHERRNNFHGVPLCATGTEIADSQAFVTCQSCHMPMVNGHANHTMAGGHDANIIRKAVTMQLAVKPSGDSLGATVVIQNKLPHKFPTGAPFRNAYLKLTAYDEAGKAVWQNYKTHPMKDDKQAMFVYTLGDGSGKPAMAPKAKEVLGDTRLEPNSDRTLSYTLPAAGIKVVRAELLYNLLLPKLVKDMDKVLTDDLKAPKRAAFSEVRL